MGVKDKSKSKRLYYPYCGKETGFCLSEDGCTPQATGRDWCRYWRKRHPVAGVVPQSLHKEVVSPDGGD